MKQTVAHIKKEIDLKFKGFSFDHTRMTKMIQGVFATEIFSHQDITHEEDMMSLKNRLDQIAVVTPLDKLAVEVAITCPRFMQNIMTRMITRSDPTFELPSNLQGIFDSTADEMQCTKAVKKKSHEFGQMSCWPKASAFTATPCWANAELSKVKFRPTGSYKPHRFRTLMTVACRAMLFALDVIISSAISVRSVATVNSKFKDFNDKLAQQNNTMRRCACKTDIDAFFNNIRW